MRWRQLVWSALLLLPAAGCASMNDDQPDHTVEVKNAGKEKIIDVTYSYNQHARPYQLRVLGDGGQTMRMPVPEFATMSWTTATDGKKHEATVPIRSKAPRSMEGKIVSFQLDGPLLRAYICERRPDFKRDCTQIYGEPK
jgi:hypothetical protein